MGGKYQLTTLGCKVNQYESQQIRDLLASHGFQPVREGETASLAVVNTCAVTASALAKSRQAIRRLARNGCTPVVVVGCGASAEASALRSLDGVVAVLGHDEELHAALGAILKDRSDVSRAHSENETPSSTQTKHTRPDADRNDVWIIPDFAPSGRDQPASRTSFVPFDIMDHDSAEVKRIDIFPADERSEKGERASSDSQLHGTIRHFAGHQRAFLKVQDGCDAFCSYCIIPRLRPRLRSKPISVAVAEASNLVRSGHKEIIVTGIFLGAYGQETAIRKRSGGGHGHLAELVGALARVEGLTRLRLSSLEPGDVDEALLSILASHDACVPHLHLPLQSGSDRILRRMNRQYRRDDFLKMIERVRTALPHPAITTDILVGFPGESEQDFQDTLDVAKRCEFLKIHAFPFSPRSGTAAARWQGDFVPPAEVRERMGSLSELERESSLSFRRRRLGEVERVIVERWAAEGEGTHRCLRGRTDRYFEVYLEDGGVAPGDVIRVRIDRVTPGRTHGTRLGGKALAHPLPVLPYAAVGTGRVHPTPSSPLREEAARL